jgi:cytochrome bd ubiquinol oxidase subunit II
MLPYVIFGLIALAVLMYVLMDGWDLGVGILFLVAPRDAERDEMMESIGRSGTAMRRGWSSVE